MATQVGLKRGTQGKKKKQTLTGLFIYRQGKQQFKHTVSVNEVPALPPPEQSAQKDKQYKRLLPWKVDEKQWAGYLFQWPSKDWRQTTILSRQDH